MKQFVLSDESINSYGFKVLTKGVDIDTFLRNPVMYYNHERALGIIGKWSNTTKKGSQLLGIPIFDEKDTLGAKIAGKVKDGFIRGASIGIDNAKFAQIGGENVVVSCTLKECSICDIPSNGNALMLYYDDQPVKSNDEFIKLYKNQTIMNFTNLKPVAEILGLSQSASVDDVVAAISILKNQGDVDALINQAAKSGIIANNERAELLELAAASPDAFCKYLHKRKEIALNGREEKGLTLINAAIRDGRVNLDSQGKIKAFWLKNFIEDFEGAQFALEQIPRRVSLRESIEEGDNGEDRSKWTLADYRKKAPNELKKNPALYRELLERDNIQQEY